MIPDCRKGICANDFIFFCQLWSNLTIRMTVASLVMIILLILVKILQSFTDLYFLTNIGPSIHQLRLFWKVEGYGSDYVDGSIAMILNL